MPAILSTRWRAASISLTTQVMPSAWLRFAIAVSAPEVWRILAKAHELRNLGEYEGDLNVDERIVADMIGACRAVAEKLAALAPL
jgi:hypothetical protein